MLGVHWIADVRGCARDRLVESVVREALIELPERLQLTRVGEPQLFSPDADGSTIAGIILIAESHVSFHCFTSDRALHADIFSCREFDLDEARSYVEKHFGATDLNEKIIGRGADDQPPRYIRQAR